MSDTPRTDALRDSSDHPTPRGELWQLACDLERELAAARAALAETRKTIAVPHGLSKPDAEFWLQHRAEIIAACRAQGYEIVTTAHGTSLREIEKAESAPIRKALVDLVALVRGECPSLLNEDSGGDAGLSMRIDEALSKPEPKAEAQADAEPVAWMHNQRVDCIHNEVKELLKRAGGHLHRPIDKTENYTIPLYLHPPGRESEPRRKPCTCHDTSRGPGRPCAVKSGSALGDLWRCVEEAEAPKAEAVVNQELTTEPVGFSEGQWRALRESHAFDAEWQYFEVRPVSGSAMSRKAFADGFERGWDAARAALAHGRKG